MSLLGGFGRSARTRGWAVLDGLHSKELRPLSESTLKILIVVVSFCKLKPLTFFTLTNSL